MKSISKLRVPLYGTDTKKINFLIFLIFVIVSGAISCKEEIPALKTLSVTNITALTATSGGWIFDEGSGAIDQRGLCWSKVSVPTIADAHTAENSDQVTFASDMSDLEPATSYIVRAYATNNEGTGYGTAIPFRTMGGLPSASSLAAGFITTSTATLRGAVNPNYISTTIRFEYGLTTSYGETFIPPESPMTGSSSIEVQAELTGLTAGTTYHYRLRAENAFGIKYSEDMFITTRL